MEALGLMEVLGRVGAVEALDAALKAAEVHLLKMVRTGGGLTTILITGEVAAVKAAVDAGGAAADPISQLVSVHVIPRPDRSISGLIDEKDPDRYDPMSFAYLSDDNQTGRDSGRGTKPVKETVRPAKETVRQAKEAVRQEKEILPEKAVLKKEPEPAGKELKDMTVGELRSLARNTEGYPLSRQEIRYARKDELIDGFEHVKK